MQFSVDFTDTIEGNLLITPSFYDNSIRAYKLKIKDKGEES